MPIYDYVCEACLHRFERVQSFLDDPVRVCPECGVEQVVKVYAPPAIAFKGSGFYKTDSRSAAKSASAKRNGDGAAPKTNGSESSSSDSSSSDSSSSGSSSSSSSTAEKAAS